MPEWQNPLGLDARKSADEFITRGRMAAGRSSRRRAPALMREKRMPRGLDETDHSPDGEAEALARLTEHERALDRRLEESDREAKALLAEADREAERLREKATAELGEAVERLRREHAGELARALAIIHEETQRRSQAVRLQAEVNRERALAWLASRVTGRDPP